MPVKTIGEGGDFMSALIEARDSHVGLPVQVLELENLELERLTVRPPGMASYVTQSPTW